MFRKLETEIYNPKILVYGKSGTGKTTSIETIPNEFFPVLIINIENKIGVINSGGRDFIVTPHIKTIDDFERVLSYAEKAKDKFKTVVIDSFTFLQNLYIKSVSHLDTEKDKRMFYSKIFSYTDGVIDRICKIFSDKVVIITALEDIEGLTNVYNGNPMLVGKSKITIISRFDIVLYSFTSKGEYKWLTHDTDTKIAKSIRGLDGIIAQDYSILLSKWFDKSYKPSKSLNNNNGGSNESK